MKVYRTDEITPTSLKSQTEKDWVYNGLDCCITAEVFNVLFPQLDDVTSGTYAFSRALQGPVLEMRLRGVRVDARRRAEVTDEFFERMDQLEDQLEQIVREGIGMVGFNWRSPAHLQKLFYDELGIPPVKKFGRPTVNRDALEKIENYFVARQLVAHISMLRDLKKTIEVLKTDIDTDDRMRTSYNIAGTTTGRFSSSLSEFGTGGNMQNIDPSLRSMFIADPGMKMAYFDAQQIQSRIVGALEWNHVEDGRYLDACESGDLHTTVAKLCEPSWPWTGVLAADREIAERDYYRHYSLRKLCKSIGHGSNFGGGPGTLHRMYKVPEPAIAKFQLGYFKAFAHKLWHQWVEEQLKTTGIIRSITQGRRQFWGDRNDHATLREAIAYDPQHSEAWIVNNGMLNVFRSRTVHLLMQGHDAIVVQYPEQKEDEIIPQIFKLLEVPVELKHGRTLLIPYGCETGWNWGKYDSKGNLDGLKEYKPSDKRKRQKKADILDRSIRGAYKGNRGPSHIS